MSEQTFSEVVEPVMAWLMKNRHPHTIIIIEATGAEMLEGVESVVTTKFQMAQHPDQPLRVPGADGRQNG